MHSSLLAWYDVNQRRLPWRAIPGHKPNPYHVLLSEFMLQQTTVATVKSYFERFVAQWPTIESLSAATQTQVYQLWQGLGYYSRANNLWRCAQKIVADYQGTIPETPEKLLMLPGVGPYTAAAIASIAYDQPVVPVDGNIIRVFSRFLAVDTPLPALQAEIQEVVKQYIPASRSGDYAQALMDLGATICTPKKPQCDTCPLMTECLSVKDGKADLRPFRQPKPIKPTRYGVVFWYLTPGGKVWVRKRPEKGLLANLMEIPGTPWLPEEHDLNDVLKQAPHSDTGWHLIAKPVKHTFTHFHLELKVLIGQGTVSAGDEAIDYEDLDKLAFPTLMRKVIAAALKFKGSCKD